MRVARGIAAQPEKESLLLWHVNLTDSQKPVIDEKNRADFKKLKGFTLVLKGQKILTVKNSENPVDGKNVLGEVIKFEEWQPELLKGENTQLSDDKKII